MSLLLQGYHKQFFCPSMKNKGMCRFGDSCKYAHSEEELKPTELSTSDAEDAGQKQQEDMDT